jgi:hypothetical protein
MNVPVFNVVIYVSKVGETVQARVMNLPDLQFTARMTGFFTDFVRAARCFQCC